MSPRRTLIVAHDLFMTAAAIVVSFYIRFEAASLGEQQDTLLFIFLPGFVAYAGIIYFLFHLYEAKWRLGSFPDLMNIVRAATVLAVSMVVMDYVLVAPNVFGQFFFGKITIALYWVVQMVFLGGPRIAYHYFRCRAIDPERSDKPEPTRFLGDAPERMAAYITAAKAYPGLLDEPSRQYLYLKPFHANKEHNDFFFNMHSALGLVQAMELPAHAEVLEVGCGPGWLTEILALLGYKVTAFDPSEDLLMVARQRLENAGRHHMVPEIVNNVRFMVGIIEELQFDNDSFDGIIFYDVAHHVVDEEIAFANCARWLRSSGVLGIVEGAWIPGNKILESELCKEMANHGTLENPFTQKYLDELLKRHGFTRIERLIGRCGFVPSWMKDFKIGDIASQDPSSRNDLVARKDDGNVYSSEPNANSQVRLTLKKTEFLDGCVRVHFTVRNVGETILLGGNRMKRGRISFALRKGEVGRAGMTEALNRIALKENLQPGRETEIIAEYLVSRSDLSGWTLDTVAEHVAWLSMKGSNAAPL